VFWRATRPVAKLLHKIIYHTNYGFIQYNKLCKSVYVGSIPTDASTNSYRPQSLTLPLTDCDAITPVAHRAPLCQKNNLTISSPFTQRSSHALTAFLIISSLPRSSSVSATSTTFMPWPNSALTLLLYQTLRRVRSVSSALNHFFTSLINSSTGPPSDACIGGACQLLWALNPSILLGCDQRKLRCALRHWYIAAMHN
jgi:hypothetical protein